jgi:hypothetical protein
LRLCVEQSYRPALPRVLNREATMMHIALWVIIILVIAALIKYLMKK